jgi:xanthine dehydrogenase YagS FAD-binding subunit
MKAFKHINAHSLDEVVTLLGEWKERAVVNAGGTDLLGILKSEVLPEYPEILINLKTVPGLNFIEEDENGLRIGAMTKLTAILESEIVKSKYMILSEAAKSVATPEIRNMGTLGGNLCQDTRCWYYRYPHHIGGKIMCYRKGKGPCHAIKGDNRYNAIMGAKGCFAVCPSDTAIALVALNASLKITGPDGDRVALLEEFYNNLGFDLKPDEIVTEVRVPRATVNSRQAFIKFRLRDSVDFAIVSVATVMTMSNNVCEDARIILGGVAPVPYVAKEAPEVLKGNEINEKIAEEAAQASIANAKPLSKNGYKVDITKTLVKRAILYNQ